MGGVLYEMVTGRRAFDGDSTLDVLGKVLHVAPPEIRELRPEVPPAVARVISRCLEKNPDSRYSSGQALEHALVECSRPARVATLTMRTWVLTAAVLVAAIGLATWSYYRNSRARWARNEALPEIRNLIAKGDYPSAFDLTRTALGYVPDDPQLKQHWSEVSMPVTLSTAPPGATVFYRRYGDVNFPWRP